MTSLPFASVKLIVWDLDDTLWSGRLSEGGGVEFFDGRAEMLRALVDRGIMLSISSKNDESAARERLRELGLWDLFIFPRVNWDPKGPQLCWIVDAAQLRAENVLFVDDLELNREEVGHQVPGIQVADPLSADFDDRIRAIIASGKDDHSRSRLAEYRILEAKTVASSHYDDNVDFLRSCAIQVTLEQRPVADAARIHELIGRTNQLNYVKNRVDLDDVQRLLADPSATTLAVRVRDRFGDYGLVGFAAVRDGTVLQLAFSCRILGMGVERAIYERLGSPGIEVAEPVAAPLTGPTPDWLSLSEGSTKTGGEAPASREPGTWPAESVLFVGGCDLESSIAFLRDPDRIVRHFNYSPASNPKLIIHRDSIDFLLSDHLTDEQREQVLATVPFIDRDTFSVPQFQRYDDIVYSPLIDYVQAKYVSPNIPGFFVSFGDLSSPDLDEARISQISARYGLGVATLRAFTSEWRPAVKSVEIWRRQLEELFGRMAGAGRVTVILGATDTHSELDRNRFATHRAGNDLMREVAARFANVECVEVDPFLTASSDFTNSIRHYSRRAYRELALALSSRIDLEVEAATNDRTPAEARPSRTGQKRQRGFDRPFRSVGRALKRMTNR